MEKEQKVSRLSRPSFALIRKPRCDRRNGASLYREAFTVHMIDIWLGNADLMTWVVRKKSNDLMMGAQDFFVSGLNEVK